MPPQPWAKAAGWGCLAAVAPSLLWRVAMLAGVDTGFAESELFRSSGFGTAYVLGLDVAEFLGGVLCVGLVRPWGEVWPRWIPRLGGHTVHRLLPTTLGALGDIALYAILTPLIVSFAGRWLGLTDAWVPTTGMSPAQTTVLLLAYIPLFCWPALLTVALVGYWRRRSPEGADRTVTPTPSASASAR